MNKEKQIEQISDIIYKNMSMKDAAIAIYDAGYHKTVWHKIADGDLPEYAGPYLVVCGDESLPEYDVDFYENFWDGKRWVHNEGRVIAWTELPTYEEKLK